MPEIFLCTASKIKESLLCVTLFDGGKIKNILDLFFYCSLSQTAQLLRKCVVGSLFLQRPKQIS